jgi:uncharacterized sulfatase
MRQPANCFLCLLGLSAVLCGGGRLPAADPPAATRPNVVLIISDDHAWTDYSFMGHPRARTPNIDRLAAEGLSFTRGYVATAICSPSLATMLTGLHAHQHGITGNDPLVAVGSSAVAAGDQFLRPFLKRPQLPQLLRDAGYLTLHTGKFWMRNPKLVGFTHDMGPTGRHGGAALAIGRETMEPIDSFIDTAIAAEQPFFIWYAPFLPHLPHNPPARLLAKYADLADVNEAKYLAMVEWLDETIGALLQSLDEKHLARNTLVLYLADNGWNEYGKAFPYENGVRTPIIARWPAVITPQLNSQDLASNLDVLPTLLSACSVALPANLPGIDLLDKGAVADRKEIFLANFAHDMVAYDAPEKSLWTRSVIRDRWKLIEWQNPPPQLLPYNGGHRRKPFESGPQPRDAALADELRQVELFDLLADPQETRNLAAEQLPRVRQLRAAIDAWWDPGSARPD